MKASSASDDFQSSNAERDTSKMAAFHKLSLEIRSLGRQSWHFIVGWILSSIVTLCIIFVLEVYQVFNQQDALIVYLVIVAAFLISAGADIYRQIKRIDKRIDKLVDLITLEISRQ